MMAYQKHELLGTNKDGSTPKRGPKTIHANVKEPLAHDHSRDFEKVAGTVAKRHTVEIHSGMHRTTGTNDGAPVTSPLVDDEKMDISPVVDGGKVGKAPPPSFGQRSRTQAGEVGVMAPGVAHAVSAIGAGALHADRHANAAKVISEGIAAHGDPNHPAFHPANLRAR
jgi:hypothetical protein